MKTPEIQVGIVSGTGLTFTLNGDYICADRGITVKGQWTAIIQEQEILFQGNDGIIHSGKDITLEPVAPVKSFFTLHAVTIGINFHWQRNEDQSFRGKLRFIIEGNKITAINILSIEDYLVSVISSEMSATSSVELLKAHAVISRSWLIAQMEKTKSIGNQEARYQTYFRNDSELIRWYDREDHHNFDVCADDHCQRYQGITRASTVYVEDAIRETWGEVLMYNNKICDARYSKCCGGMTELFENVWEEVKHPYLKNIIDGQTVPEGFDLSLNNETDAIKWISGNPDAFCNTDDRNILSQVLNNYDLETNDFFRWKVTYTGEELSDLIRERSGIDFGIITDLMPVERGASARIVRLKIEGSKKSLIIGKELEIRKTLSKTHLYSSAFFVEKKTDNHGLTFILHGAGWGHGVGLCQIGAAVMGAKGCSYRQILQHYFTGATLEKKY